MWYDDKNEWIDIFVQARPGSSKNEIVGVHDGALKIKLKAPAVEGAANKELIKFLSKRLKIAKSEIRFVSGERSKRKCLRLPAGVDVSRLIEE